MHAINHIIKQIFQRRRIKLSTRSKKDRYDAFVGLNKFARNNQIVFTGDSITQEYPIDEFFIEETIYNRGVNGYRTDELLRSFKKAVIEIFPRKIFILIGTNDMSIKDTHPETALENTKKIIELIQNELAGCGIYLLSVYPINISNNLKINKELKVKKKYYPSKIIVLNKLYKNLAREKEIAYIDIYNRMVNEDNMIPLEYTIDGLHLSVAGYSFVSEILKQYL